MATQSLSPLTSLRFIAAGAVLLCHRPLLESTTRIPFEEHGPAGVSFFFLLSGFILAYTYRTRLVPWAPREGWNFLVARFARLWPVYLLAFLFSFSWMGLEGFRFVLGKFGVVFWRALAHLTMVQAHIPRHDWHFAFNPPAWSLSAEWTFYLLFPLILNGLATGSWVRRVAVFLAASATWATVSVLYFTAPADVPPDWLRWKWLIYICPFTRLFDFTCGVALGLLFVHLKPAVGPARGTRFWLWGLVEIGAIGALGAALYFSHQLVAATGRQIPHDVLSALGYFLPFFALIVWVGALGRGPLSRVASTRLPVYLGEISYAVYLFHFPILLLLSLHFHPTGWSEGARVWAMLALDVGFSIAMSALSYHLYEVPLRHWLRKKLSWSAPAVAAPVAEEQRPEPRRLAA